MNSTCGIEVFLKNSKSGVSNADKKLARQMRKIEEEKEKERKAEEEEACWKRRKREQEIEAAKPTPVFRPTDAAALADPKAYFAQWQTWVSNGKGKNSSGLSSGAGLPSKGEGKGKAGKRPQPHVGHNPSIVPADSQTGPAPAKPGKRMREPTRPVTGVGLLNSYESDED